MAIHEDGMVNVSESMIRQARKDFIKGGKILYKNLKKIPSYKELMLDPIHRTLSNDDDVRWMYDSWRFVEEDPYQFFGDIGEESIINEWKKAAIEDYYRTLYLKGATILFNKKVSKSDIKNNDSIIIQAIQDIQTSTDFIAARNYIYSIPNGKKLIKDWNVIAYARSKKYHGLHRKNGLITNHNKNLSKERQKRIEQAKEMYDSGMSEKEIAKELSLHYYTIRTYLTS